ncbi:response regulator transcription factor [Pseudonocardia humida]|uniref:Response regulator transcription factor n=1 Tax=Pseudonocardia humida TaxID=2800819 RepID=A0ABT0ZZY8_9PSEU|nr:response regulator transcription factor [Pseudonocardia humida]MCO1656320.1 response regulator transcription factor [Pseudonocardia humida]
MAAVLVVEDDTTIGEVLESSLRAHGYRASWAVDGRSALHEATARPYDLILVDLGLPDVDGFALCRHLRARQPSAVLVVLTARNSEMDVVVGLDAGADDYLVKPVRLTELLARLRAHLRRAEPSQTPPTPRRTTVTLGDLVLDTSSRRVTVQGVEIALRPKEFDLLARLVRDTGTALSRRTLMVDVWDEHWHGSTKTLDVHVASLRRRMSAGSPIARLPTITTLRGHGYRLDAPSTDG